MMTTPFFFQKGLEFSNTSLELLDRRCDLPLRESLMDVLLAVHIPSFNIEQDGSLDCAWVHRIA